MNRHNTIHVNCFISHIVVNNKYKIQICNQRQKMNANSNDSNEFLVLANNSDTYIVFISTNISFRWLQYMKMAYYVETLQQNNIKHTIMLFINVTKSIKKRVNVSRLIADKMIVYVTINDCLSIFLQMFSLFLQNIFSCFHFYSV